ncbi:MAG: hypothetical protein GY803_27460, partial [Chloroflexi bacterium]|nr:hypothetical protein [Chloroflexota bacterium]
PLSQRVGLSIRLRETGELIVGLHEVGFPRPTRGIQLAIRQLAKWAVGLHPDTEVVASSLAQETAVALNGLSEKE